MKYFVRFIPPSVSNVSLTSVLPLLVGMQLQKEIQEQLQRLEVREV